MMYPKSLLSDLDQLLFAAELGPERVMQQLQLLRAARRVDGLPYGIHADVEFTVADATLLRAACAEQGIASDFTTDELTEFGEEDANPAKTDRNMAVELLMHAAVSNLRGCVRGLWENETGNQREISGSVALQLRVDDKALRTATRALGLSPWDADEAGSNDRSGSVRLEVCGASARPGRRHASLLAEASSDARGTRPRITVRGAGSLRGAACIAFPKMPDLYHLSSADLGAYTVLEPRLPRTPAVGEDTTIPRIAVAASVENCLAGITALKAHGRYHVYRLRGPARGADCSTPARLVPDWAQTHEVWLLEPNMFRRVGTIDVISTSWDTRGVGEVKWCWVEG